MTERQNQTPAEMEAAIEDLKRQITTATQAGMQRIACDPESIEQGLAKLVLGLIELVGSSRVDLQACKLEYSIVSPK